VRASLLEEERGHLGPSVVECDLDYFIAFAAADRNAYGEVHDGRALPVRYPVDLENRYLPTWPPFLLDLMPQGHARRKLAEHMRLGVDDRASDVPLLMRAAGHPIGNIRVREAVVAERERLAAVQRAGARKTISSAGPNGLSKSWIGSE
jgi:serine/threonine-protein kinase HipA